MKYNTAKANHLKILDPIHNEGIRLSIGAFKTSSTDSILCYSDEIPLRLKIDKYTLIYMASKEKLYLTI